MLSRWASEAARLHRDRAGKSHHISLQTERSSGIHFHSSDSLSCTNLIFVWQLQAKWSPGPSAHSGITIKQASTGTTTLSLSPRRSVNSTLSQLLLLIPASYIKPYRGSDQEEECEEGNEEQGDWHCTVIFIGRRYEMLFRAIKEKPQGCWCGDEGTVDASRKTRCPGKRGVWRCGFAVN